MVEERLGGRRTRGQVAEDDGHVALAHGQLGVLGGVRVRGGVGEWSDEGEREIGRLAEHHEWRRARVERAVDRTAVGARVHARLEARYEQSIAIDHVCG